MERRIDTLVENGQVVTGGAVRRATLAVSDGIIAAILDPDIPIPYSEGANRIDASGKVIIPGVIDAHIHLANFNDQADTFTSASTAAAFGGVTTVMPYIQGRPGMPVREFLTHFRDEGEAQSLVDFAMHCRLQAPERGVTRQFDDAFDLGVTSFKMFMAYRKRGIMWDDYNLYEALEYIAQRGGIYCCHAENGDIIDYLEDRYGAEGRYTPENYLKVRPPEAEAEATFRALTIAGLARCPIYLVHMSTGRSISLAHQAKLAGQTVWVETCPQYMTLTADVMNTQGGRTKFAPPAREVDDVNAVWAAASNGVVQIVGSDHAPWPLEKKDLPPEQFAQVPYGIPGVETMLPLVYSEGVATGRISITRMVELLCEQPAQAFGLAPRKGAIAVGADADLVLIDPDVEWTISAQDMHSQAGYTPYEGRKVRGKPVTTMIRGQVVVQDGRLRQSPGYGSYLARAPRSG